MERDWIECGRCEKLVTRRSTYHISANGRLLERPVCRDCYELGILRETREQSREGREARLPGQARS